jgi:glutathionyl-hydroquinone reductase
MIVRKLKGLEEIIPVTSVHYEMLQKGTDRIFSFLSQYSQSQDGAS